MKEKIERYSFNIGEEATITRIITDDDIREYARISGDENPLHINDEYAQGTKFGGRIAHGTFVSSIISAVLGTILPGPGSVYLSQQLKFFTPVRPGDRVTLLVRVTHWNPDKGHIKLFTEVRNQEGMKVIKGEVRLVMSSFLNNSSEIS